MAITIGSPIRASDINSIIPIGAIIDFAGTTAPSNYLACPTTATTQPTATYPALFAAIGYTWGGSGANFGIPWFPADYASVQSNGNVGSDTVGQVINHVHPISGGQNGQAGGSAFVPGNGTGVNSGNPTTGAAANFPAGVRVLKCIRYQ